MDYALAFTHPSEVELRASLDGKGAIDLDVDEFSSMMDRQRRKAIAKRDANDKKKEVRVQVLLTAKEKREAE